MPSNDDPAKVESVTGMREGADGFEFPELSQWQRWAGRQRRVERVARRVRPHRRVDGDKGAAPDAVLLQPRGPARTLVVIDHFTASCRAAIVDPLGRFDPESTAVLTHAGSAADITPAGGTRLAWQIADTVDKQAASPLDAVGVILSLGGYLSLSEPLVAWARRRDIPFVVVQHGLLTPWSPPAPPGAHVLAWNDADAAFWAAGRPDVTTSVTGSQLLWSATPETPARTVSDRPVVLGQLHGSELPRRETFFTYWEFCRRISCDYRPHPNESDAASRALHEVMRRGGISFESSGEPLTSLHRPVVSIFSTGTLEAAQQGLPAWVVHPDPPTWVRAFWKRYGLAQYGTTSTKAWPMNDGEPAARVARAVEKLGGLA